MELRITGLHRLRRGRYRWRFGGVRGTKFNAHTHVHTNTPTSEAMIILLNKPTLWANVFEIFSQAPAHRRPLDNGGNEERDRRLEVGKLLTALSYCVVGGSFTFAVFQH